MTQDTHRERRARRVWWLGAAVVALLVFLLLAYLQPLAPRHVDILTGPAGSSYHALGDALAAELREAGIDARVVETRGAVDNLDRLGGAERATVAFAQANVERELEDQAPLANVVSLGSLAFEPFWVFVRSGLELEDLRSLAGMKVALGPRGSGARAIGETLLEANGLQDQIVAAPYTDLGDAAAADALLSGRVDAVFLVGGTHSASVSQLLVADGVEPASLVRATTYAVLFPSLARFDVPAGVFDLGRNIPAEQVETLATTTNLLSHADLHGGLLVALLDAARGMNTRPRLESPAGQFPSMEYVSLPLDRRARRYYENGPPTWSRYLPYGVTAFLSMLVTVVLPTLAVLVTLLKAVPAFLRIRFSIQGLALTRRLMAVEQASIADAPMGDLQAQLDAIDRDSAAMRVPRSQAAAYLELRQNLHDARERLEARGQEER